MSGAGEARLDRRAVRRAHDRASAGFDAHAVLHAAVRTEMLARLDLIGFEPRLVLDLGAGTGEGARALARRWPRARVVALDVAPGMLRAMATRQSWRRRFDRVQADAERLPLATGRVDLAYAGLVLHWATELDRLLAEVRRVLAPRGYFTFSTLGPDTLAELRAAWREVDAGAHVHRFLDMHDVGDALVRAGFADPVMDVERVTLTYDSFAALRTDLRGMGARNALAGRARGLGARGLVGRVAAAYERFRQADGRLPATCEVVYGQAWCPGAEPPVRGRRGEVVVSLDALKRR